MSAETPSFIFEGQTYADPAGLAEAFAHNWEEAKKRLYRGHVRRWVEAFNLDLANRCQDLEEGETDQDRGVFRLIYHLHPGTPFAYRGEVQSSPQAVGAALGRALEARDRAAVARIAEATAKGLLSEWLRCRGGEELGVAVDKLAAGLCEDRDFALFRLHFLLCPERPYRSAGSELATPSDVAHFLARAWAADLLAWLSERGRAGEVAAWRAASGGYEGDRERGLAVFLNLVCPETASESRLVDSYRARVEARLERVAGLLESHVYLGVEARELQREGQDLAGSGVNEASDYSTLTERHGRAHAWLGTWERLRRNSSWSGAGDGVFTHKEMDQMATTTAWAVGEALDRVEALDRSLGEQGGALPRHVLTGLSAEAKTSEERLALLDRIQAELGAEADWLAGRIDEGGVSPEAATDRRGGPWVTAVFLSLLFTWPGFGAAGLALLYTMGELQWSLATVGKSVLGSDFRACPHRCRSSSLTPLAAGRRAAKGAPPCRIPPNSSGHRASRRESSSQASSRRRGGGACQGGGGW